MKLNDKRLLESLISKYGHKSLLNEMNKIDIIPEKIIKKLIDEIYNDITSKDYNWDGDRYKTRWGGYGENLYDEIEGEVEISDNNIDYYFTYNCDINLTMETDPGDYYTPPYTEVKGYISNLETNYNIYNDGEELYEDDKKLDVLYIRQIEKELKNLEF